MEDLLLTFRHEAPAVRARIERLDTALLHTNSQSLGLPVEILVGIFEMADSRYSVAGTRRLWRTVAVNTSSLWTKIELLVERKDEHFSIRPDMDLILLETQRASERPLDLSLSVPKALRMVDETLVPAALLEFLRTIIRRSEAIHLTVPSPTSSASRSPPRHRWTRL